MTIIRLSDIVPGSKMCCICFDFIPIEDLWVDDDGQKWDICKPCNAYETVCKVLLDAGYTREQILELFKSLTVRLAPDTMDA